MDSTNCSQQLQRRKTVDVFFSCYITWTIYKLYKHQTFNTYLKLCEGGRVMLWKITRVHMYMCVCRIDCAGVCHVLSVLKASSSLLL